LIRTLLTPQSIPGARRGEIAVLALTCAQSDHQQKPTIAAQAVPTVRNRVRSATAIAYLPAIAAFHSAKLEPAAISRSSSIAIVAIKL
jgi:hypothetical protein